MKYSKKNPPVVCMLTQSTRYKAKNQLNNMKPKGILIHSTGANNPKISRYVQPSDNDKNRQELIKLIGANTNYNDWNHKYTEAGVNAFIGKLVDGSIGAVQTLPWNYAPWGCGSGKLGSCNTGWIQFEVCEADLDDKAYFKAIYKESCELIAYLCKLYSLDPFGTAKHCGVEVPVILCHWDSYELGLGSSHRDVYHWFNKHSKTMYDVRKDVAALLKADEQKEEDDNMDDARFKELWTEMRKGLQNNTQNSWSKTACDWAIANGIMAGGGTLPDGTQNYMYQDLLTREQMCVMLYRFAQLMGKA